MFGQPNRLPGDDPDSIESKDLRKRAKYLRRCNDVLWARWSGEYIKSLRKRHTFNHKKKELQIRLGEVVLIQSDERNGGKWNLSSSRRETVMSVQPDLGRKIVPGARTARVMPHGIVMRCPQPQSPGIHAQRSSCCRSGTYQGHCRTRRIIKFNKRFSFCVYLLPPVLNRGRLRQPEARCVTFTN